MIKVIHQGLGPIGLLTAQQVLGNKEMEIIGAIDTNPALQGKDLGSVLGLDALGILITGDLESMFKQIPEEKPLEGEGTVLVLTTSSRLRDIAHDIGAAVKHHLHVVSPAEELFYPDVVDQSLTNHLDDLAQEHGVVILGRGVNPGCLMDAYPLSEIKTNFDRIISMEIHRSDDLRYRRKQLQTKTGVGLDQRTFTRLSKEGKIGHVGLCLSARYLADNLGFKKYALQFSREPVFAECNYELLDGSQVTSGQVSGIHEVCIITHRTKEIIRLELTIALGIKKKNFSEIYGIRGTMQTHLPLDYSNIVQGDLATARILHEAIYYCFAGSHPGLNRSSYAPNPFLLLGTRDTSHR